MKILFAASEAVPLVKTGGLADVAGSLPIALQHRDIDVRLILPAYPEALEKLPEVQEIARFNVGPNYQPVRLLESHLEPDGLPLLLVAHEGYFDRPGNLYTGPDGTDWSDNARRFGYFCQAIAAVAQGEAELDWVPDLVHCNDWQTGLVPAILSEADDRPRTLFTIHNLAYQGVFPKHAFEELGLPWSFWKMDALEYHGEFAFIKGGITFADHITTVSPGYAEEVLTEVGGHGLDGALRKHASQLSGILNGIDYQVWNPAADPHIEQTYDETSLDLKSGNKTALQSRMGLHASEDAMLFAHIGRMVYQKGVDLIVDIVPRMMEASDTQLVILGSGDRGLESAVRQAAERYPGRIGVEIGYDEPLSHLIEAGADAFLMPSRFEPCGLNQMYSLRYGTVPIVHHVGGLADTVVDTTPTTALNETATGFVFHHADADGLWYAVNRSIEHYRQSDGWWTKLALSGMKQDFSWDASADHYIDCYLQTMES